MRKSFLHTALVLLTSLNCLHAQTVIPSGNLSGVLTAANSPYEITGDVTVPKDSTLRIEAGVTLNLHDSIRILVDGNIQSLGTQSQPNLITCTDTMNGWYGIFILGTQGQDTNKFFHTKIEYSGIPIASYSLWTYRGVILRSMGISAIYSSPLIIDHCTFRRHLNTIRSQGTYIRVSNSSFNQIEPFGSYAHNLSATPGHYDSCDVVIENCSFVANSGLVICSEPINEEPNVIACTFSQAKDRSLTTNHGWIKDCIFLKNYCRTLILADFDGTIENCVFDSTYGDCQFGGCIELIRNCSKGVIKGCTFSNCQTTYGVIKGTDASCPAIVNCKFYDNIVGVALNNTAQCRLVNSIFANNTYGFASSNDVTVSNCVFVNNQSGLIGGFVDSNQLRLSGAFNMSGGTCNIYNSIFWNNRNYFDELFNGSYNGNATIDFYNCIVQNGISSINKKADPTFAFSDTYQNSFETYPNFKDTANCDFTLTQDCSNLPIGFNKGYASPISMSYQGTTYADILSVLDTDYAGNQRIWDDTADIGIYETQALAGRIDIEEDLIPVLDVCENNSASLIGKARSVDLQTQWQRSTDGSTFSDISETADQLDFTSASYADSGNLYRVIWNNGCSISETSQVSELRVHTPQNSTIQDDFTMPKDSTVVLSLTGSFVSYLWSNDETTQNITVKGTDLDVGTHTISVTAIDQYGCSSTAEVTITVVSGASIQKLSDKIKIAPNPAQNSLQVSGVTGSYSILTLQGQEVQKGKLTGAINIQELPSQTYIILVNENGIQYRKRWIKQ